MHDAGSFPLSDLTLELFKHEEEQGASSLPWLEGIKGQITTKPVFKYSTTL